MSGSYSGQGPVGDKRRARELGFGMSPGAGAGTGNGGTGTRLGLGRRYSCSVACTSPSWADTDAPPPAHLPSIAVRLPHCSLPRFDLISGTGAGPHTGDESSLSNEHRQCRRHQPVINQARKRGSTQGQRIPLRQHRDSMPGSQQCAIVQQLHPHSTLPISRTTQPSHTTRSIPSPVVDGGSATNPLPSNSG